MRFGFDNLVYQLEKADMTPELYDELVNFSFDSLRDVVKEYTKLDNRWERSAHRFSARFLECLKRLVRYHFYSSVLRIFII